MLTLGGRTCVFAGATGNVGRGAAAALAAGGMNVVIVSHDLKKADELCRDLRGNPGQVIAMSSADGDASVYDEVEARFGNVDVVINNIGNMDAPVAVELITEKTLNEKLSHQVTQPFLMAQAAIPYLKKSRAGRIIFNTTVGAQNGFSGESMLDSIGRGGILSMTYCLARELLHDNITVNCVAKSGMINDHSPIIGKDFNVSFMADQIPIGRAGTAEEYGTLISYIASEESAFVTGQVFQLSGGLKIG